MIYTERTVTVKSGKSSIDEPVILYRGDRELEIRFIINETKFKYYSGDNVITKTQASYGQLVIAKPDKSDVFSEITECKDGAVIFTITHDMIDELPEVGFYTFQIRLYGENKISRVTIPPIEKGIEVREPIAIEADENGTEAIVDEGTVGYALVRGAENSIPTFNDNGGYNKTVWSTGDIISEGKLNKIEDALDVLNQNNIEQDEKLNLIFSGSGGSETTELKDLSEEYTLQNSYVRRDGVVVNDERALGMLYIPLSKYDEFYVTSEGRWSVNLMVLYDADKNFVYGTGAVVDGGIGKYDNEHIVVADLLKTYPNASYVSFSAISSDISTTVLEVYTPVTVSISPSINVNNKPLTGKKWVVVGDSLTESNRRATKNYHDYVAEETGVTVVNMGRSGTGYKRSEENELAFYQRILSMPTDADIITIFGSGNDLSQTLGSVSDTGTDTICGCIHQTIQNLFSIIPGAKVGIVLPCPWGGYPPSTKGNKMELYCDALKEIAGYYSIPVLDLYHGSNLRPWDETFKSLYYKRDEGNYVHPDEDGHALLANKFKMFIQSL